MPKRTPAPAQPAAAPASVRGLIGAGIVVVAVLAGALNYYQFLSNYSRTSADALQIAAQQDRIRPAAAAIPAGENVGYLSDLEVSNAAGGSAFGTAQYVVAPRLLLAFPAHREPRWIIGNYFRPVDASAVARQHGLEIAADYGAGVVLFRRAR